jgi:hypothetical protein
MMSISEDPKFSLSNTDLGEAMEAIAERDTPERRRILYQALLNSILIVPTPDTSDDPVGQDPVAQDLDEQFLDDNDELTFLTFEDDAGDTVLIAFANESAALNWEPEGLSYVGLQGPDLLLIAMENEVGELVINPAGPHTLLIQRDEIAALAQGEVPISNASAGRAAPVGMTVLIGPPEETPPASWRNALREVLKHYPSVEAAYFFQLHVPPEGARHVIGLVLYEGLSREAQDALIETILEEFEALLPEDQELDFVILDEPDFRKTVEDTVSGPLYTG